MSERTILVLLAFAGLAALFIAIESLLAIFYDLHMHRKQRRPSTARRDEPWGKS